MVFHFGHYTIESLRQLVSPIIASPGVLFFVEWPLRWMTSKSFKSSKSLYNPDDFHFSTVSSSGSYLTTFWLLLIRIVAINSCPQFRSVFRSLFVAIVSRSSALPPSFWLTLLGKNIRFRIRRLLQCWQIYIICCKKNCTSSNRLLFIFPETSNFNRNGSVARNGGQHHAAETSAIRAAHSVKRYDLKIHNERKIDCK